MTPGAIPEPLPVGDLASAAAARIRASTPLLLAPGEAVRFAVSVEHDHITDVAFNAHRCVTLFACCEAIARWAPGRPVTEAARLTAADLLGLLAGVPPSKADRAAAALRAFRAALAAGVAEAPDRCAIPTRSSG